MTTWRRMLSYLRAFDRAPCTWPCRVESTLVAISSKCSLVVEVASSAISPRGSTSKGTMSWLFMVCGNRVQVWSAERTTLWSSIAERTGQSVVYRQQSASIDGACTPSAPSTSKARVLGSSEMSATKSARKKVLARARIAFDRLAVGQGGVDLLADVADLDELAVERLQADEVAFGALRAHLVSAAPR